MSTGKPVRIRTMSGPPSPRALRNLDEEENEIERIHRLFHKKRLAARWIGHEASPRRCARACGAVWYLR
jgi:hypothetical protein